MNIQLIDEATGVELDITGFPETFSPKEGEFLHFWVDPGHGPGERRRNFLVYRIEHDLRRLRIPPHIHTMLLYVREVVE